MDLPDQIFHCCFNWNGSRLVTTCKDKKIRIFDPRSGELKNASNLYFEMLNGQFLIMIVSVLIIHVNSLHYAKKYIDLI